MLVLRVLKHYRCIVSVDLIANRRIIIVGLDLFFIGEILQETRNDRMKHTGARSPWFS